MANRSKPKKRATLRKETMRPAPKRSAAAKRGDLTLTSWMAKTNGGGSPEDVPDFDLFRAVTAGFETRRIGGPTLLAARPDGGFFSQSGEIMRRSASSPAAKPENVIGADSRVIVTNTSNLPWRCICHLEVEYDKGPTGFGTGLLIGPHTVVTAAHVVCDPYGWDKPREARNVRVVPGRNGNLAPYGYFVAEDVKVPDGWKDAKSKSDVAIANDFAAVMLPHDNRVEGMALGKRLGYFGLKSYSDANMEAAKLLFVNNAGYPYEADKPYGTLWYNAGRVRDVAATYVEYMVDTEGGQSGSPIYYFDEVKQQRYVIAIHTTGDFVNWGLRITEAVFEQICEWSGREPEDQD